MPRRREEPVSFIAPVYAGPAAFGNAAAVDSAEVLYAGILPTVPLSMQQHLTALTSPHPNDGYFGILSATNVDLGAVDAARNIPITGMDIEIATDPANAQNYGGILFGLLVSAFHQGTGNIPGSIEGFVIYVANDGAGPGVVGQLFGGTYNVHGRGLANAVTGLRVTADGGTISNTAIQVLAGDVVLPLGAGTGKVTAGAANSGGAGFRQLVVPN